MRKPINPCSTQAILTLSPDEMSDLHAFCQKKLSHYHKLKAAGLRQNVFSINLKQNHKTFWIRHQDGMSGIRLNEFRDFRRKIHNDG